MVVFFPSGFDRALSIYLMVNGSSASFIMFNCSKAYVLKIMLEASRKTSFELCLDAAPTGQIPALLRCQKIAQSVGG